LDTLDKGHSPALSNTGKNDHYLDTSKDLLQYSDTSQKMTFFNTWAHHTKDLHQCLNTSDKSPSPVSGYRTFSTTICHWI